MHRRGIKERDERGRGFSSGEGEGMGDKTGTTVEKFRFNTETRKNNAIWLPPYVRWKSRKAFDEPMGNEARR